MESPTPSGPLSLKDFVLKLTSIQRASLMKQIVQQLLNLVPPDSQAQAPVLTVRAVRYSSDGVQEHIVVLLEVGKNDEELRAELAPTIGEDRAVDFVAWYTLSSVCL
jgi:hypothetical protein